MEKSESELPTVWGMDIVKRQEEMAQEIMQELQISKSPRVEILLATNYGEFILKDFMEFLLKTKKARDVPRNLIVDILEEKKLIDENLAYDIRQIFHIRDAYAHRTSLNQSNEYVEKQILPKLNCVKKETPKEKDWEKRPLIQKITDVSNWVFVHLRFAFHGMVVNSFSKPQ